MSEWVSVAFLAATSTLAALAWGNWRASGRMLREAEQNVQRTAASLEECKRLLREAEHVAASEAIDLIQDSISMGARRAFDVGVDPEIRAAIATADPGTGDSE